MVVYHLRLGKGGGGTVAQNLVGLFEVDFRERDCDCELFCYLFLVEGF